MDEVARSIRVGSTPCTEPFADWRRLGFALGGFVAGEGCFSVHRVGVPSDTGSTRVRFRFSVMVAERDAALVSTLHRHLNGAGGVHRSPARRAGWQPTVSLQVTAIGDHLRATIPYRRAVPPPGQPQVRPVPALERVPSVLSTRAGPPGSRASHVVHDAGLRPADQGAGSVPWVLLARHRSLTSSTTSAASSLPRARSSGWPGASRSGYPRRLRSLSPPGGQADAGPPGTPTRPGHDASTDGPSDSCAR